MNAHQPVLLQEVIEYLAIRPSGIYIDATFGRGGHSQAILKKLDDNGRLLAIDNDPQAIAVAKATLANDKRFSIVQAPFGRIAELVRERGYLGKVDGILLDLGVSSPQLDDASRGFSFSQEGPLDMRFNPESGKNAATWLATAKETDIAEVLKTYGEERFARRIAQQIVATRVQQPIKTTHQLVSIIKAGIPVRDKHKHPATRSFQAIRIFINNELRELETVLDVCLDVLAIGGRLLVISFHSLEDRLVKRFLRNQSIGRYLPIGLPVRDEQLLKRMRRINGVIKPTEQEIEKNVRARSAILRVGEKIA